MVVERVYREGTYGYAKVVCYKSTQSMYLREEHYVYDFMKNFDFVK